MNSRNYKNPLTWFAVGFGSGLSPFAPGTLASFIAGLIFYYLFFPFSQPHSMKLICVSYLVFLLVSFFFGLFIYKSIMNNEKDEKIFVWDEFVGMWIACFPLFLLSSPWPWILISLISFRIFDIWKPLFIGYFDRLKGALGVMMDDVLAGLISALVLYGSFNLLKLS